MKKIKTGLVLIAALALLVPSAAFLSGCSSENETSKTENSSENSESDGSEIGKTIKSSGLEITLDNAAVKDSVSVTSSYLKPKDGNVFVYAEFSVYNPNPEAMVYWPNESISVSSDDKSITLSKFRENYPDTVNEKINVPHCEDFHIPSDESRPFCVLFETDKNFNNVTFYFSGMRGVDDTIAYFNPTYKQDTSETTDEKALHTKKAENFTFSLMTAAEYDYIKFDIDPPASGNKYITLNVKALNYTDEALTFNPKSLYLKSDGTSCGCYFDSFITDFVAPHKYVMASVVYEVPADAEKYTLCYGELDLGTELFDFTVK